MPGLSGRMSTVVKAKISKLLDRAEDPSETLEYSYQKQIELLQNVKKGIADVVTSKKRLQLQEEKLQQQVVKLDTQARQALSAGNEELARNVAMHIAWSDPRWIDRDAVPGDVVDAEREIYANSEEVLGKPEQAREKIVEGMLNKRFFAERGGALLEQPWIHESSKTVGQALKEAGAEVLEYERLSLAG